MENTNYTIHTDGGSRGNPGPSAIGAVIEGIGIEKKEYGQTIGHTTNNVAEYQAVVFALKKLKQLIGTKKAAESTVTICADSELLVRQLNGEYKIKDSSIQELFLEIWNLRLDFSKMFFQHIRREQNQDADRMVNHALDENPNRLDL